MNRITVEVCDFGKLTTDTRHPGSAIQFPGKLRPVIENVGTS